MKHEKLYKSVSLFVAMYCFDSSWNWSYLSIQRCSFICKKSLCACHDTM